MSNYLVEEPYEKRFESGEELLAYISKTLISRENQFAYRGHRDTNWKLESSLWRFIQDVKKSFRGQRERDLESLYDSLTDDLKYYFEENIIVNGDVSSEELRGMDTWQFGQHYGLPTPLLDWTQSPYAALFFALDGKSKAASVGSGSSDEVSNDRCLWVMDTFILNTINESIDTDLRPKNKSEYDSEENLNKHYPKLEIVREINARNKRIRYQQGLFTHPGNLSSIEVWINRIGREMPHPRMQTPFLRKLIFPCPEQVRNNILDQLDLMNINSRTLFPDIEGSVRDAVDRAFRNSIHVGRIKSFSSKSR